MTEKQLQTQITKFLKGLGVFYIKSIVVSKAGCPDILTCINGRFIGLEVKKENGIVSDLQKYQGDKIMNSGGEFYVVRPSNWSYIRVSIQNLYDGKVSSLADLMM